MTIPETFCCKDCDWIGDEPPVERDGDPYQTDTNFWQTCPKCGSKNVEQLEE